MSSSGFRGLGFRAWGLVESGVHFHAGVGFMFVWGV